jgi:hypothetical protein
MYWLAQAPIAPGSERGVRLANGGCVERLEGVPLEETATFLVDIQLEASGIHPVYRLEQNGLAYGLDVERRGSYITAHIYGFCDQRWVQGTLPLSGTTGKRLAVRVSLPQFVADISELQPWGPVTRAETSLSIGRGLARRWKGMRIGGPSDEVAGESFRGRVTEFAVYPRLLSADDLEGLRQASIAPPELEAPRFEPGALDEDGRHVLLDDYSQLVEWSNRGQLSRRDLREAAVLAHLWLLDNRPLLHRARDHYGAMVSCPDLRRGAIPERIEADKPVLWTPASEHAGNWVPVTVFRNDLACWLGEADVKVSWTAFIKFVRNKLGGGHYDPDDRTRWQRQLNELAHKASISGNPWLESTMLILVRSLIVAADGSGLISLLRGGL